MATTDTKMYEERIRSAQRLLSEQTERATRELNGLLTKEKPSAIEQERRSVLESNLKRMRELSDKLSQIKDFTDLKIVGEAVREFTTFLSLSSDFFKSLQSPSGLKTSTAETDGVINKSNIEKVRTRLNELSRKDPSFAKILDTFNKNLNIYQGSSGADAKLKSKKLLESIIGFPGWGVVENPKDKYTLLEPSEVKRLVEHAMQRYREAGLEGTEELVEPIIESYALQLSARTRRPGETGDRELDPEVVGPLPILCIDGPPGTGKTSVAKAIARALDMGFYDISMAGKDDTNLIYGRGEEWGAPGAGLVAKAMLDARRERVLILLDEAEKTKGTELQDALGQVLEVNQRSYRDDFFGANIDKRKCAFVLTTNKFELLPSHIQDRVRRVYLGGYTDPQKTAIIQNLIVREFGSTPGIKVLSNDSKRRSDFFIDVKSPKDDAVKFLVENYITEPGIREARDLLKLIQSKANAERIRSGKQILIDCDFITRVLGKPHPSTIAIKKYESAIAEDRKQLTESSLTLQDKISLFDSDPAQLHRDNVDEFSDQLRDLIEARNRYFVNERNLIKQLHIAQSNRNSKFASKIPKRLGEHQRDLENTLKWTNVLLQEAFEKYREAKLPIPRDLSDSIIDSVAEIERSSKFKTLPKTRGEVTTRDTRSSVASAASDRKLGRDVAAEATGMGLSTKSNRGPKIVMEVFPSEEGEEEDLVRAKSIGAEHRARPEKGSILETPSFKAAALRSAKLGHKWKHIGGISPLSDDGWIQLYHEVKDKIKEEIDKGLGSKPVKHPERYSKQALADHAHARQDLYRGWSISTPEPDKSSTSFHLKKEVDGKPQLMVSITRNLSEKKLEITSARPIPEDSTIFQMLEVAYANSRRTGNRKIMISDCTDAVSSIKLREYALLMNLEVDFDDQSNKLIETYTQSHRTEVADLIKDIQSQRDLIKHTGPDLPEGPKISS